MTLKQQIEAVQSKLLASQQGGQGLARRIAAIEAAIAAIKAEIAATNPSA